MAAQSIAGINIKIGADLSELKKELGAVDDTVKENIDPARKEVKGLSRDFNDASSKAHKVSINVQEIAAVAVKLGSALTGFTKGLIEEAVKVDPTTAANVEAVKESFASIKTAIVGAIIPLIETWGPKLTTLFQSISTWITENPETAKGIVEISTAIGGIAVAAGTALPLILELQMVLAGVSAASLGIVGIVVGTIAVLGLLSTTLDEIGAKASETAETIATMDTTTQHIVELGTGELKVENRDDIDWVANVWDPEKKEFVEGFAYLDELTGEYVLVSEEVATAVTESTEAITSQNTALETTKTTAEQATEIFTQMQETLGADTFQQFINQPIAENVGESWTAFGEAVGTASTGFTSLQETLGEESTLSIGLANIQTQLDSTKTSAENLGAYLSGDFVSAITILMTALCLTSTDEEGNTKAGGGNTLYNSLGQIFGVFSDIYATSQLLAQYWTTEFITASQTMMESTAKVTGVVQGLADAAGAAAANILAIVGAYEELERVTGGGGGGGTPSGGGSGWSHFGGGRAAGGPVHANTAYLVGELRPEIFVPHTNGTIIPSADLGSGQTINVIFQGDVIGDEKTISAYVTRAANKAIREAVYAAG